MDFLSQEKRGTRSFPGFRWAVSFFLLAAAMPMLGQSQNDPESEVAALADEFVRSLNTADLEAMLTLFSDRASVFGPLSPAVTFTTGTDNTFTDPAPTGGKQFYRIFEIE